MCALSEVPRCILCPAARSRSSGREAAGPETTGSHDAVGGQCPADHSIMSRAAVDLGGTAGTVHLKRAAPASGCGSTRAMDGTRSGGSTTMKAKAPAGRGVGPELLAELRGIAETLRGQDRRSQAVTFFKDACDCRCT